jgi:hypothetical protein
MRTGRRGFLGLFSGAVASAAVAAKTEPITKAAPPIVEPPKAIVATLPHNADWRLYPMTTNGAVTTSASVSFALSQSFVRDHFEMGRAR